MDFDAATQVFLRLFYFVGLSTFDPKPIKSKCNFVKSIFKYGFCVLFCAIVATIIAAQYYYFYEGDGLTAKLSAVARKPGLFHITVDCLLYFSVAFQSICFGGKIKKIYLQMRELNAYASKRLSTKIDFHRLKMRLVQTFLKIFSPVLLSAVVLKTIRSRVFPAYHDNCQIALVALSTMILMQAIFFVEVLNYFMQHSIDWMHGKTKSIKTSGSVEHISNFASKYHNQVLEYQHLKCVHYKLWEISVKLSKLFGYNYIFIIFRNWLQSGHNLYGIFIVLSNFGVDKTLMRTYFIFDYSVLSIELTY